jgi:hypothetical protein
LTTGPISSSLNFKSNDRHLSYSVFNEYVVLEQAKSNEKLPSISTEQFKCGRLLSDSHGDLGLNLTGLRKLDPDLFKSGFISSSHKSPTKGRCASTKKLKGKLASHR